MDGDSLIRGGVFDTPVLDLADLVDLVGVEVY